MDSLTITGIVHGVKARLVDRLELLGYQDQLKVRHDWFDTGVRYQMIHALGLLIAALLSHQQRQQGWCRMTARAFLLGCFLFSGSLYVMTFAPEDWKKLGAVVPLGGLSFIIGWVSIAYGAWRYETLGGYCKHS